MSELVEGKQCWSCAQGVDPGQGDQHHYRLQSDDLQAHQGYHAGEAAYQGQDTEQYHLQQAAEQG